MATATKPALVSILIRINAGLDLEASKLADRPIADRRAHQILARPGLEEFEARKFVEQNYGRNWPFNWHPMANNI